MFLIAGDRGVEARALREDATHERRDLPLVAVGEPNLMSRDVISEPSSRWRDQRNAVIEGAPHQRGASPLIATNVVWKKNDRRICKLRVQLGWMESAATHLHAWRLLQCGDQLRCVASPL